MANKTMNFAVDLLPKSSNTYDLGNDNYKWNNVYATNLYGALDIKTYPGGSYQNFLLTDASKNLYAHDNFRIYMHTGNGGSAQIAIGSNSKTGAISLINGQGYTTLIPTNTSSTAAVISLPSSSGTLVTGQGTSGSLAKFDETNKIVNGPAINTNGTGFLRQDGNWATPTNTNTHRPIQVDGTEILGNNTTALNLKAGSNVSITHNSGTVTIAATDTNTWRPVSDSVSSSSSSDAASSKAVKAAYDLAASKTSNTGTVTKISTGAGLTGGDITSTGTINVNLTSETQLTNAAVDGTETSGRVYPIRLDKNGKLAVNVPWIDEKVKQTNTGTTTTNSYALLLSNSTAGTTTETAGVNKDSRLVWNPGNYALEKTSGHLVIKTASNLILDRNGSYIVFRKEGNTNTGCVIDSNGNFTPYVASNTLGLGTSSRTWASLYVKQGNITADTESTSTSTGSLIVSGGIGCAKSIRAASVWGAVWNDYAEFRKDNVKEKELQQPGRCVREVGDGTLTLTDGRLQRGCEIISDTFGFAIGQDKENGYNTPIASSGRVLAYLYEDRELARNFIGWPVCSGPDGTVSIMTEEEENRYSNRIVGTISEIPDYEEWGTGKVKVNGRIWIRIK